MVKLHDVYTEMPGTNGVGDAYLIFEHLGCIGSMQDECCSLFGVSLNWLKGSRLESNFLFRPSTDGSPPVDGGQRLLPVDSRTD